MTRLDFYEILFRFGVRAKRPGFFYTAQALYLLSVQPDLALNLKRDLYPKIAEVYHVTCESVKHDISATLHTMWRQNPELLSPMAQEPLSRYPHDSRFLLILSDAYSQEHCTETTLDQSVDSIEPVI